MPSLFATAATFLRNRLCCPGAIRGDCPTNRGRVEDTTFEAKDLIFETKDFKMCSQGRHQGQGRPIGLHLCPPTGYTAKRNTASIMKGFDLKY